MTCLVDRCWLQPRDLGQYPILWPLSIWLRLPAACGRDRHDSEPFSESHTCMEQEGHWDREARALKDGQWLWQLADSKGSQRFLPLLFIDSCAQLYTNHTSSLCFSASFSKAQKANTDTLTALPPHPPPCPHTHSQTWWRGRTSRVIENHFTSKMTTDTKWLDRLKDAGTIDSLNESLSDQKKQGTKALREVAMFFCKITSIKDLLHTRNFEYFLTFFIFNSYKTKS